MRPSAFFRTSLALLGSLALLLCPAPPHVSAQNVAYHEDFEGAQPSGWDLEPGWLVTSDGANHVLVGQGHVWARSDQFFDGDLSQSFRLKLLSGRIHIVIRLTAASRYFIGFDADGSDLNKQFFPDDFQNGLAGRAAHHDFDRWYQLELVLHGDSIEFRVDGQKQWSYTDTQPLTSGSLAFETLDDSQAYVDDITVELAAAATGVPSAPTAPASGLTWVRTGGPLGGLGYDVRMRPDNPEIMFVTDAWAGLFTSTDGGRSWSPSNAGITTRVGSTADGIPVFSATIDPNDPDTLWIGTQFQRGIFKSVDGGRSWSKMDGGIVERDGITFRGFSIQPGDSNVVYAAAEISSWAWAGSPRNGREFDLTRGVIYKTTNGGQSWQAVWRGDNLARYVWINPRNPSILYISTGFFDREAANSDPTDPGKSQPGGEGILKSTDGGKTWNAVNDGLDNLYVTSLFMNPYNPDILLAGTGNNQYYRGAGVYLTEDGGASWARTLATEPNAITAVEFSESDPAIAYAGSSEAIYRSEDGGHAWARVTPENRWGPPGVAAGFPIDFQVDPRDPDRLFANEYGGGNFLTVDGGRNWTDASRGYTGALMRGLAVDPSEPARIYAAARSGLFVSQDGGRSWQGLGFAPLTGLDWTFVAVDPEDPQHVLAETSWSGLGSSSTRGLSWKLVLPEESGQTAFRAMAFSPSDPRTVYAGRGGFFNVGLWDSTMPGQGVYVSHDRGDSWSPANSGLAADANVSGLVVDPADSTHVYAATTNRGLLQSTDGGATWMQVGGGLSSSKPLLSISMSPQDPNLILVGLERGAVYRTTDGGQTWRRAASGLHPEATVTGIVFDPAGSGSTAYLSDVLSGVYRSADGGVTWSQINQGLLMRAVNQLALSGDGLHLYAGTEGNGVYRLDLNGLPPTPVAAPPSAAVTSTAEYLYQSPAVTATPSGSAGGGPSSCIGAALPLAFVAAPFVFRRRKRAIRVKGHAGN